MPMHRANKAPRTAAKDGIAEERWFKDRVSRDKARKKIAKASRKRNR